MIGSFAKIADKEPIAKIIKAVNFEKSGVPNDPGIKDSRLRGNDNPKVKQFALLLVSSAVRNG